MKSKPKAKIIKTTWTLKTKVKVKNVVVATLTPYELAMFIVNQNEMDGLRQAIGKAEERRKALWGMANERYGLEEGPFKYVVNLKTGEITEIF
jgi:hypothetical protein